MNTTTLQVPVQKGIRDRATKAATAQGLSSLQEAVRIFLHQLAGKKVQISLTEPPMPLSAKNEARYAAMLEDVATGVVGSTAFSNTPSLVKHLNG